MATTKKVGGSSKNEKKAKKPEFDLSTAVDADGKAIPGRTDGKLKGSPANFDRSKFRPLKATHFADRSCFLEFQADQMEARIQRQKDAIQAKRDEATTLRELGDDETRKKASKLIRAKSQLEKLEKELADGGFDLSLLTNLQK